MSCSITLREVAEFQKGFAFKSKDYTSDGVRIIKVSNLTDDSVDISQCVCVENDIADKYKDKYNLKTNDIVITTVGSWPTNPASVVGKVIRIPKYANNTLLNQNAVRLRSNSLINQNYMYYLLKDKSFKEYIVGTAQGSANQASITQEDIKNFEFILPSLEEQEKIANILSSLDNKIELNNEMNKTLEEMAQSIFKRWFVDFEFPNEDGQPYKSSGGEMVESELGMIPKGWEVATLKDLLDNIKISVKAGNDLKGMPYLPIDTIPMKKLGIDTYKSWEEAKSSLIKFNKNDILLGAMRVYFHRVVVVPFEGITRSTCFVLRPKNGVDHSFLTLKLFEEDTILYANSTSKGTTMPYAVWENGLADMPIVIPNLEVRKKFNDKIEKIIEKISSSFFEQNELLKLRNALLQKLVSGELDI